MSMKHPVLRVERSPIRIAVIVVVALIFRAVLRRMIDRAVRPVGGETPRILRPFRDRLEGSALFENGEPTEIVNNVKRYLSELQQMDALTKEFVKFAKANNLLTPLNMRVRENDRVKNIAGCYVINEERLKGVFENPCCLVAPHQIVLGDIRESALRVAQERE